MVRRHGARRSWAARTCFPAGASMQADHDGERRLVRRRRRTRLEQLDGAAAADAVAYHVAAARELFEEAGVLLARDAAGSFVSLAGADDHERFKRDRHDVHAGTRDAARGDRSASTCVWRSTHSCCSRTG